MNEETIQAAREAWKNDREAACMALLGKSSEEVFIEALRGCNQHGHKPGCPEADGGGSAGTSKENGAIIESVRELEKKRRAENDAGYEKIKALHERYARGEIDVDAYANGVAAAFQEMQKKLKGIGKEMAANEQAFLRQRKN